MAGMLPGADQFWLSALDPSLWPLVHPSSACCAGKPSRGGGAAEGLPDLGRSRKHRGQHWDTECPCVLVGILCWARSFLRSGPGAWSPSAPALGLVMEMNAHTPVLQDAPGDSPAPGKARAGWKLGELCG